MNIQQTDKISQQKELFKSKEILPLNPNKPMKLKEVFNRPPKYGLQNVGRTCLADCCMNPMIQCFCHIEKFSLYFKYEPFVLSVINKYKGKDCLTQAFKLLIENLWPNDNKYLDKNYIGKNEYNDYYKPFKFRETISNMNPLFKGSETFDLKDLFNFLLMTLHEELNIGQELNNNQKISESDEGLIYQNFCKNFYYENNSIISDLFYGINGSIVLCSGCGTRKYNYQIGTFYIFPLDEVRKYRIKRMQQQDQQNLQMQFSNNMFNINYMQMNYFQSNNIQIQDINSVDIFDCFDYNQKIEYFTGDDAIYCNICNGTKNITYQNYIANCPEVIIIILDRGKGFQFNVQCKFTEFLDIRNYVKYNNNTSCQYKLIGVVTHIQLGHFVAFCKSPIDNQWYIYNDSICFLVNNFKEEVIDYSTPYILFYQKI